MSSDYFALSRPEICKPMEKARLEKTRRGIHEWQQAQRADDGHRRPCALEVAIIRANGVESDPPANGHDGDGEHEKVVAANPRRAQEGDEHHAQKDENRNRHRSQEACVTTSLIDSRHLLRSCLRDRRIDSRGAKTALRRGCVNRLPAKRTFEDARVAA